MNSLTVGLFFLIIGALVIGSRDSCVEPSCADVKFLGQIGAMWAHYPRMGSNITVARLFDKFDSYWFILVLGTY